MTSDRFEQKKELSLMRGSSCGTGRRVQKVNFGIRVAFERLFVNSLHCVLVTTIVPDTGNHTCGKTTNRLSYITHRRDLLSCSFYPFTCFYSLFNGRPSPLALDSNFHDFLETMSSIKPGASRALRSKAIAQTQQVLSGVSRGIAATTKNATLVQSAGRPQSSTPFNLQGQPVVQMTKLNETHSPFSDIYRPLPHQFTPQSHTSLPSSDQSSFSGLLNAITHTLSTTPPNGRSPLPYLHTLLRSYASDPGHWSQYAHANPDKQYTRNLVCEVPGVFNLLLLVWTPGKASPVHDHADAHCLMKAC